MKFVVAALALAVSASVLSAPAAEAADLNCSRVKIIVPFGPGGSADVAARLVADRLGKELGTTFYVENKAGAASNLGNQAAAEAPADGCTLLINGTVIATFVDSFPNLRYNPLKDLTPVGGVGATPSIIVAPPQTEAKTINDLVALSKAKAGGLNYAMAGFGLQQHLATAEIARRSGAQFTTIPYKGGGPALADVLAGRVDFATLLGATAKVHIEQGKLKPVAVLQDKRSPLLPDVPSAAEQGFPKLYGAVQFLLFAPAKTPKATIDTIGNALHKVVSDKDLQEHFLKVGLEATPMTPEELTKELEALEMTYAPIIKQLNIKLN